MADLEDLIPELSMYAEGVPDAVAINALRVVAREFCQRSDIDVRDLSPMYLLPGISDYTPTTPTDTVLARVIAAQYNSLHPVEPVTDRQLRNLSSTWRNETGSTPLYIRQLAADVVRVSPYLPSTLLQNVASIADATPIAVTTSSAHGLSAGDFVYFKDTGVSAIDGSTFSVTIDSSTIFSLVGTTASGASTEGSWAQVYPLVITASLKPSADSLTLNDRIFEDWRAALIAGACAELYMMPSRPWSNPGLAGIKRTIFEEQMILAGSLSSNGFVHPRRRVRYGGY